MEQVQNSTSFYSVSVGVVLVSVLEQHAFHPAQCH